jgi:hypothetical protein
LDEGTTGSGNFSGGWSLTITTKAAPLTVTTGSASAVSSNSAMLNGLINPLGSPSTWAFQFGTSPSYSDTQPDQSGGSGTIEIPVNSMLTGLTPGTTYNFRLTGKNTIGAANGANLTFTTAPFVDTDGDGMPNDYETANGLNPSNPADGVIDSDGDGMTNVQEYRAGTSPFSASSVLRITSLTRSGDDVLVTFPTVFGKRYRLEYSTPSTLPSWQTIEENIMGTGQPVTSFDFAVGDIAALRIYRIAVQQ